MSLTVKWGKITTYDGSIHKDCLLKGKIATKWDWSLTNLHHNPGIQIADVMNIIDKNTTTIILSKGMHNVLQTMPETISYLHKLNLIVYHLTTPDAVATYNELVDTFRK